MSGSQSWDNLKWWENPYTKSEYMKTESWNTIEKSNSNTKVVTKYVWNKPLSLLEVLGHD